MKLLRWNWLKWREKSVPKKFWGYFSHPLNVYEASHLDEVLGQADIVSLFLIRKKKIGSCLLPAWLQMQCSGASIEIFNYQLLYKFYDLLLLSLSLVRSNSNHCQQMDLFTGKENWMILAWHLLFKIIIRICKKMFEFCRKPSKFLTKSFPLYPFTSWEYMG